MEGIFQAYEKISRMLFPVFTKSTPAKFIIPKHIIWNSFRLTTTEITPMLKRNRNIIYEYEVCPEANPGTIKNDVVSLKFVCHLYTLKLRRFSTGTLALVVLKGSTLGSDLKFKLVKLMALMGTPNSSDISLVISWLIRRYIK